MGKAISKALGSVGKVVSSLLGGGTGGTTVKLPDPVAADIPEDANVANEATVKIGADTLADSLKKKSSTKSTFSSLGGGSSGISI